MKIVKEVMRRLSTGLIVVPKMSFWLVQNPSEKKDSRSAWGVGMTTWLSKCKHCLDNSNVSF